jgi:hypothetical protein
VQLALVVQNALQSKNATRREAIENGKYLDPFTQPLAILQRYLNHCYAKVVTTISFFTLRLHTEIVQELKEKYIRDIVGTMNNEIGLSVATYKQKFAAFFGDLLAKWNARCIELYPLLPPPFPPLLVRLYMTQQKILQAPAIQAPHPRRPSVPRLHPPQARVCRLPLCVWVHAVLYPV